MGRLVAAPLIMLALASIASANVWYVDKDNASGVEDGKGWPTAFTTIQPAIDAAFADGGGEVWVAEGAYDEQRVSVMDLDYVTDDVRLVDTGSVLLRDGLQLYGGFSGGENERHERSATENVTVIDGTRARSGNRAYHVAVLEDNTILDGFVVRGGDSTTTAHQGGGVFVNSEGAMLRDCIVEGNAGREGGGLFISRFASCVVSNCIFRNNTASYGSAICTAGVTTIVGSAFVQNEASEIATLELVGGTSKKVEACYFGYNIGWAGVCYLSCGATFANCTIEGNDGGLSVGKDSIVRNCVFRDNTRALLAHPPALIENSLFEGNEGVHGAALTVYAGRGFGEEVWDYWWYYDTVDVLNCVFRDNHATRVGAAVNCVGENDGGVHLASAALTNCTLVNNTCDAGGSAMYAWMGDVELVNVVSWNPGAPEMTLDPYATALAWNCNIEGGWAYSGMYNINADPMFMNPENGDLRLRPDSPCIDAGTALEAPDRDFFGMRRPVGAGVDIGAHEYFNPDINADNTIDALDIQLVINAALGLSIVPHSADINTDGKTNAIDIQIVINAGLD